MLIEYFNKICQLKCLITVNDILVLNKDFENLLEHFEQL